MKKKSHMLRGERLGLFALESKWIRKGYGKRVQNQGQYKNRKLGTSIHFTLQHKDREISEKGGMKKKGGNLNW